MRNSSLVECLRAEDLPGLSIIPKLRITRFISISGRGAFHMGRSGTERSRGLYGSEYAGVSNDDG